MYTIYLKEYTKDTLEYTKQTILDLMSQAYHLSFSDLKKDSKGKPLWFPYYLSITHSYKHHYGCVGIAISTENIGIDIEVKDQLRPLSLERKICFNQECITNNDELLTLWTKKEALYKWDNTLYPFNQVDTKKYDVKTTMINIQGHEYFLSYTGEACVEVLS